MANRDLFIVERAATQDLISLDEAKIWLGLETLDPSKDAQLQMQISVASATVAELANRTFGEETLVETWREIGDGRLFLSHWPIKDPEGIISVFGSGMELVPPDYDLEGDSGKIDIFHAWGEPAIVSYTGGYKLPDEAPLPLKQACFLLVQEARIRNQQAQTAGIRQLRHKEAHVSFFDPNALLIRSIGAQSPGQQAAVALIKQYMRFEV